MAQGVGFSIDASFLDKIEQADKQMKKLAETTENASQRMITALKNVGTQGLGYLINEINRVNEAMSKLGTTNKASNAVDSINKLSNALNRQSKNSGDDIFSFIENKLKRLPQVNSEISNAVNELGKLQEKLRFYKDGKEKKAGFGALDAPKIQKEADFLMGYITLLEKEKATLEALKQTYNTLKRGGVSSDDNFNVIKQKNELDMLNEAYRSGTSELQKKVKAEQDFASWQQKKWDEELEQYRKNKEAQAAIDRRNHEKRKKELEQLFEHEERLRKRQLAIYNATADSSQGALNYTNRLFGGAKTFSLNNAETALQKLQEAQRKLNLDTDEGRKKYERLGAEISRVKIRTDAFTKANENVANSHRGLLNLSDQLMRKFALVFSVSQIQGYINKLAQVRGEFELQKRALQAILQSKDDADKIWQQTVDLAVRSPFRVGELVKYTKQLAAYRIETDKLHETTKRLADVSSGLGVDMNRLILAYGQVRAAEYLRGTELRQFTEAGIPLLEELARHFTELEGRAISTADVFGMISKRMVAFEDVAAVFQKMTDAGGVFYNMQEIQAETLKGQISNLHDKIDLMLNDIGEANDGVMKGLVSFARDIVENWKEIADQLETAIYWLGAYKVATMAANFAVKQGATTALWFSNSLTGLNGVLAVEAFSMKKSEMAALGLNRAKIFLAKTTARLQLALKGVKMTLASMFPALLIVGVYEITRALTAAARATEELHDSMRKIDLDLSKDLEKDIALYRELTAKINDVTVGYSDREQAMQALKRTFGEILPDQLLEINNVKNLKNNYDEATTALQNYYNAKSREQKINAINESFANELQVDIDELAKSFANAEFKGANKTILQKFGLDEKHIKVVLNNLVEDVKKGNVKIDQMGKEFEARINRMFGVDIDLSNLDLVAQSLLPLEEDISDLTETLQRYRNEIDILTGISFDTIENEKFSKEKEKQQKLYDAELTNVNKLKTAYSNLYRQAQINKKKGGAVSQEDIDDFNGYRKEVEDLYRILHKSSGIKIPTWDILSKTIESSYDIEGEMNRITTAINTKFIGGLQSGISKGNTLLAQMAENIQKKTDSLKPTGVQEFTKQVFKEVSELSGISLSAFDKVKADSKDSLDEVVKNVGSEIKALKERRDAYDRSEKALKKAGKSGQELSDSLFLGFQMTPEQRTAMEETIKAFEEAYKRLGGAEDKETKKTKKAEAKILKNRIALIKQIYKDLNEALKTMKFDEAVQQTIKSYEDTFKDAFEGTGINLSGLIINKTKLEQVKTEAETAGEVFSESMLNKMREVSEGDTYIRDFTDEFVSQLKKYESFIESAKDVEKEGKGLTIGYGEYGTYKDTGKTIKAGDTITEEEATKRLTNILLPKYRKQLNSVLDVNKDLLLTQEQYNVLLDLTYQGGKGAVERLISLAKDEQEALVWINTIRAKYAKAYGKDAAAESFGDAFVSKFKEAETVYERMALLLKTMNLTVKGVVRADLPGMVRRSNERAAMFSGDLKVIELLHKAAVNIAEIDFTNVEGVIKLLKSLKPIAEKEGKEAMLTLEKTISGFEMEIGLDIRVKDDKALLNSIENMFGDYEMSLELEKLNIPPNFAKQLFNVDSIDLSEIRQKIEAEIAKARGSKDKGKEDLVKELEKDLKKVEEFEQKAQEERLKKYVKYSEKQMSERAKVKFKEMKMLDEIEKTFKIEDTDTEEQKSAKIAAKQAALVGVAKEAKEELAKLEWQSFKQSDVFASMYQDLDKVSSSALKNMIDQLNKYKNEWTDLPINEMKEVIALMEKLKQNQMEREAQANPFKGIGFMGKLKDSTQDQKDFVDVEANLAYYQKQIDELDIINQLLLQGKLTQEDITKYNEKYGITITSNSKDIAGVTNDIKQQKQHIQDVVKEEKKRKQTAQDNLVAAEKQRKQLEAQEKALGDGLKMANDLYDAFKGLYEVLGGDEDSPAAIFAEMGMNMANTIIQTMQLQIQLNLAAQSAQGLGAAMNTAMGIVGWIVMGVQLITQALSAIIQAHDKALENTIQDNLEYVEKLQRAYEKLEKQIEDAYSVGAIQTSYDLAKRNMNQQLRATQNMIEMEEKKKKKDEDRIKDWKNEIEDMNEQLRELEEQRLEDLGGLGSDANYKSAAEDFTEAWFDAYREVGDGIGGLEDTFNEFIDNVVKKQLLMRGTNKLLEPVLRMIDQAVDDGMVTTREMAEINEKWNNDTKDALNSYYQSIYQMYEGMITGAGELSDLARGVQNITEPQAAAIEAYLNSMRFFVSDSNRVLKEIQQQMSVGTNNPMVSELKAQTQLIRTIDENLSSVIGKGSSSHTGAYLKVLVK